MKNLEQYYEFNKVIRKWVLYLWILKIVEWIHKSMNSEYDSRRLLLKLSDTTSLEWSDKNVALLNLNIYNT